MMALKRSSAHLDKPDAVVGTAAYRYAPAFHLSGMTDLVVVSSDHTLFAVRSLHLRSASSVFDDILAVPQAADQQKRDGHPLLELAEGAEELDALFRYVHPGKIGLELGSVAKPTWDLVLKMSTLFDKYDTPLTARLYLLDHLPSFLGDAYHQDMQPDDPLPTDVFAVAVIHGLQQVARAAIRAHCHWGLNVDEPVLTLAHKDPEQPGAIVKSWRPSGLGDLEVDVLSRLPPGIIKKFSALHQKALSSPGYTWDRAADDFTVSIPLIKVPTAISLAPMTANA